MSNKMKKLVIAGGGTAGWMAAALLSKTLGKNIEVVLVESDEIPTVGVGEATIPPLMIFHQILGVDEREFMARTNSTFKTGISFENWREKGHEYVHSFGFAGKDCWACSFVHFWLGGLKRGIEHPYSDYCVERLAAENNKFAILPDGRMNYAYHMDAGLYAGFLRELSEKAGVHRKEGKISQVNLDKDSGFIESLSLQSGEVIDGDFFIDCTGFRGLLIEKALNTGYEDWSHWLPCDSALAVQTEKVKPAPPYTRSIAHDAGWQWRIPLQNRVGNGLVYSSKYQDDQSARELLVGNLEGETINDPKPIKFRTGTRRKHWNKNCLALGLASGFLEPLESTSIHLVQKSLIRFMQLFPTEGVRQTDVDEFNQQTKIDVERIRDFIILHYKVTNREDSEFWRFCKNMEVPDALQQRIDLFAQSGRAFKAGGELFGEESWIQVMLGQGIIPEAHHPIVDVMADKELEGFLGKIRKSNKQTVDNLPPHEKFLDYYCSATSPRRPKTEKA